MQLTPWRLKQILNFYPPYIGAGVKVTFVSKEWRELHVTMTRRWYNRNAVGTHFGGSLYSMVDPHLMLLLMQLLGKEYVVWDKSATIEFVKASRSKLMSIITISDEELQLIRKNTESGDKYFTQFTLEITDQSNDLVARVEKTLYVRKKRAGGVNP